MDWVEVEQLGSFSTALHFR